LDASLSSFFPCLSSLLLPKPKVPFRHKSSNEMHLPRFSFIPPGRGDQRGFALRTVSRFRPSAGRPYCSLFSTVTRIGDLFPPGRLFVRAHPPRRSVCFFPLAFLAGGLFSPLWGAKGPSFLSRWTLASLEAGPARPPSLWVPSPTSPLLALREARALRTPSPPPSSRPLKSSL